MPTIADVIASTSEGAQYAWRISAPQYPEETCRIVLPLPKGLLTRADARVVCNALKALPEVLKVRYIADTGELGGLPGFIIIGRPYKRSQGTT